MPSLYAFSLYNSFCLSIYFFLFLIFNKFSPTSVFRYFAFIGDVILVWIIHHLILSLEIYVPDNFITRGKIGIQVMFRSVAFYNLLLFLPVSLRSTSTMDIFCLVCLIIVWMNSRILFHRGRMGMSRFCKLEYSMT